MHKKEKEQPMPNHNPLQLATLRRARTGRCSSWDVSGRNGDAWTIPARSSRVLADIKGPGVITHIWMTQGGNYRNAVLKITWDDAPAPSVLCPLGDFFGLGHAIVNSYQSQLFTASTWGNNTMEGAAGAHTGCALNCYAPMPFRKRALIELLNESDGDHGQYFYIDYEQLPEGDLTGLGYFHAEFRRACPFLGWAPDIAVNTSPVNIPNLEREAWANNYVILETKGRGHYLGCNLSVTNIQGTWWGEGDDMIWVDGYKWPPDLHGTGSEDYLNQAWGMQTNAFLRNGSSIHESNTGGYQSSYVHHLENPVRFEKEIKVTIEHGHANHLGNEMASVAYWYAERPAKAIVIPPVEKRRRVPKVDGKFVIPEELRWPGHEVRVDSAVVQKARDRHEAERVGRESPHLFLKPEGHSPFLADGWQVSRLMPTGDVTKAKYIGLGNRVGWEAVSAKDSCAVDFVDIHAMRGPDGLVYLARTVEVSRTGEWVLHVGHDGGARVFVDGQPVAATAETMKPAPFIRTQAPVKLAKGKHEIVVALNRARGEGWGIFVSFAPVAGKAKGGRKPIFPS
jgi:hypothetical protein